MEAGMEGSCGGGEWGERGNLASPGGFYRLQGRGEGPPGAAGIQAIRNRHGPHGMT